MGQRSQIFVRYEEDGAKKLCARYYGWNYGERMISRARYGIEWLKANYQYPWNVREKLSRILDTNFDMVDVVISSDLIEEWKEYGEGYTMNEYIFHHDNNDGKLLLDVAADGKIRYAFLDWDNKKNMSAEEYMQWDNAPDWDTPTEYMDQKTIRTCKANIKKIDKLAKQMTDMEVEEFLTYKYKDD